MKRKIGTHEYGSALGDWLKGRRGDIATSQAGDTGNASDAAAALRDAFAGACGMSADEYDQVESGSVDLTAEQADALAAELAKNGIECTGADLLAIDKAGEPEAEQAKDDAGDMKDEADAEMRKAFEAVQHEAVSLRARVGETDSQIVTLRAERDEARASVASLEPLAAEGRKVVEQRRADVLKRVELRGGKATDRLRDTVAKAGLVELGAIEDALGLDPLVDALCKSCGAKAEPVYRSSEPSKAPALHSGRERTTHAIAAASRAYRKTDNGRTLSAQESAAHVRALPDDQFFALADQA